MLQHIICIKIPKNINFSLYQHAKGNVYLQGYLMHDIGQVQTSLSWFDRALAIQPNTDAFWFSRGTACQALGRLDEAIANYREAIRCNPDYTEAYRAISVTKEFTDPADPDLASIEAILTGRAISQEDRMRFQFVLAKIYEDLGDYDRAFHYCCLANAAKRSTFDYSVVPERARFESLKQCLTRSYIEQRKGTGSRDEEQIPIFIIGMPRSGTTLAEQILASHPDVHGAGEISALQDVLNRTAGLRQPDFADRLVRLENKDLIEMADVYQKQARRNCEGQHFVTDKMTDNYLYVGLIYLMFPQARVIHCRRDPLDTCLSCYKRLFGSDIKYAYDLRELGQAYCLYRDYMNYWQALLPGFIYDVQYESLVADQEQQSRRLLEFCGLPWDDRCLSFYETERVVKTSSFAQVRKPIYRSSVHLWKYYEGHLQPLLDELGRCGVGPDDVARDETPTAG